MEQGEFFDAIKRKRMKEVQVTLECGCQLLYSPITKEAFGKPCHQHKSIMSS